eukprot:5231155-Pyramimonas_sp.AAC.1
MIWRDSRQDLKQSETHAPRITVSSHMTHCCQSLMSPRSSPGHAPHFSSTVPRIEIAHEKLGGELNSPAVERLNKVLTARRYLRRLLSGRPPATPRAPAARARLAPVRTGPPGSAAPAGREFMRTRGEFARGEFTRGEFTRTR